MESQLPCRGQNRASLLEAQKKECQNFGREETVVKMEVSKATNEPLPYNKENFVDLEGNNKRIRKTNSPKIHHGLTHGGKTSNSNSCSIQPSSVKLAVPEEEFVLLRSHMETIDVDSELRATKWKLSQMEIRFQDLINTNNGLQLSYNQCEEKVIAFSEICKNLRRSLEKISREKDVSDAKAYKLVMLENRVQELQASNNHLEATLLSRAHECTMGFAHRADDVELDTVRRNAELENKCENLQKALEINVICLERAKLEIKTLQNVKEGLERELETSRAQLLDSETVTSILKDKNRLYVDDDSFKLNADLERALTIIKQSRQSRSDDKNCDLLSLESAEGAINTVKDTEEIHLMNLKLTQERDRFKEMWKTESIINRDLKVELSKLSALPNES